MHAEGENVRIIVCIDIHMHIHPPTNVEGERKQSCMCIHRCAYLCMHVEAKGGCWVSSLIILHLIPFRQDLCMNVELVFFSNFNSPPVSPPSALRAQACPYHT